ncbi:CinA family protein [Caldovatus aquaticus]|uniref:Nicotinamide-nucleotide amidohydrolase family protein n=1 Tax=Caldovatus aquaticus TaxID=2865671 RepID=A0ABS7F1M4_9PROT|nr:nicotinamide-nucleotide amidohydrolase family protein [Caldovatus aquaticus]MBW8269521.1 nicotinamide-nucleotide amidohydrolase family protein [Caldovatus aquaticus]
MALLLPATTLDEARALLAAMAARGLTLATAESCTGGLIAAALTAIAGSSAVVVGGFVAYSNAMKTRMVGVPEEMLRRAGAVSEEVARAMAEGALRETGADLALSCTGIAGPGGATPGKPVGLVFVGVARRGGGPAPVERHLFPGDRAAVRAATVDAALALARRTLGEP